MPGFLDMIRQEIDRGIVQIGARSRQLVETTQIRSQIRLLQSRKDQGIKELGEVVYEMLRQGAFDQTKVEPYVTVIRQLDEQLIHLEEQLRKTQEASQMALRAARAPAFAYCTCGEPLKETSKFCPRCGQDVRAIVEQARLRAPAGQRTCPSCGTAVGAAPRFCPTCGYALTQGG